MSTPLDTHSDRPASDFVPDDLTPEQHAESDAIMGRFTVPKTLSDAMLLTLFVDSIAQDTLGIRDKFNLPYMAARSDASWLHVIFEQHPWLPGFMRKQWERYESWHQVRLLKILRTPTLPASLSDKSMKSDKDRMMDASFAAFQEPYQGNAAELLINAVDRALATENAYNRSMTIIQSSGMGKSRVVDEAARTVFTIPFNVREKAADGSTYPPSDSSVRDHLQEQGLSDKVMMRRHIIFLTVLFEQVTAKLPGIEERARSADVSLAEAWYKFLRDGATVQSNGKARDDLYLAVVNSAKQREDATPGIETLENELSRQCSIFLTALRSSLCRTAVVINHKTVAALVRAMVYFDEAHTFVITPGRKGEDRQTSKRSSYHNLASVLHKIRNKKIATIFLSTNPVLESLAPPSYRLPPSRAWDKTLLIPPFTELPFDIFAKGLYAELLTTGIVTLNRVCAVKLMVRFGRALWPTQFNNGTESVQSDIVEFALGKLAPRLSLGNDTTDDPMDTDMTIDAAMDNKLKIDETDCDDVEVTIEDKSATKVPSIYDVEQDFLSDNKDALFAALAIRIMLQFSASRESSREAEAKQVESHMRIVYSIPKHREFMFSGTSTEPLLVEAAARLLNSCCAVGIATLGPYILAGAFQRGFLARGERGEMDARLLWTIAHDAVALANHKTLKAGVAGPVCFHRPIRLLDFLKALLQPDLYKTVLKALPVGDDEGLTLEEAFKDAYLHFSHFVLAGDSKILTAGYLMKTLFRGMALQCRDGQQGIDMLAAISFGDPDTTPLGVETTSVMQKQVKNRITPEEILVNPNIVKGINPCLPVLTLVAELGSHRKDKVQVTRRNSYGLRSDAPSPHSRHYQIVIHGSTHETYKVIPEHMDPFHQSILAEAPVLFDHPRGDLEPHKNAIQRQKPSFTSGDASWDWF